MRRGHQADRRRFDRREGPSLGPWRQKGGENQAIGSSRGGQTIGIHALADTLGRPRAFGPTPGDVAAMKAASRLPHRARRGALPDRRRGPRRRGHPRVPAPGGRDPRHCRARQPRAHDRPWHGPPPRPPRDRERPAVTSRIADASPPATPGSRETCSPPSPSPSARLRP